MSKHVVVWLDHNEARVFQIHPDGVDEAHLTAPKHHHHKHPRGGLEPKSHPDDAKRFFHEIARSLDGHDEILVVGPSTAKLEFIRHVHKHDPALEPKIVGVESVDHPTGGQLVAYARKYFVDVDRLRVS
ncbi:MAG TPA: hypothetical protein VLT33_00625 [Labilithrix sp.]|nr:hypothetical protein [Labilithrix sp.]